MKKREIKPPALADRLLTWYGQHASLEDLQGDMEELFYQDLESSSPRKAKLRYWQRTLSLIFSYAVKRRKQRASYSHHATPAINFFMIENYFLIASRNLIKNKFFTAINVLGLSVGMSLSLLLLAMLAFIYRYDNFHEKKERIVRITTKTNDQASVREYAGAPAQLADQVKENFSGVEAVVRINRSFGADASYDGREIPLNGYFADPSFLNVFTFPLLKGNSTTALQAPHTLLITAKASEKMFGNGDPIGKVVTMGDYGDFEITGILRDIPQNSHFQFEVLAPYAALEQYEKRTNTRATDWSQNRDYVYLLLQEHAGRASLIDYLNSKPFEYFEKQEIHATFNLQSLKDIVPGPSLYRQIGPDWDYPSLSIFLVLTLLILLPACFNYANISISRALKRMKEIGLRKVMGGQRDQIFFQFITESVLITFLALGVSYFIFNFGRHEFLAMIAHSEALNLDPTPMTIVLFIAFALLVGAAAGVVPALYFSKLNPIQALKSKLENTRSKFTLRKALIVFQFALSLGFITGVVIVFNQYRESLNYNFGFQQANILDVQLQGADPQLVKNEFSTLSSVQEVSLSSHVVGTGVSDVVFVKNEQHDSIEVVQMYVDDNYIHNLNLTLLAGKNFEAGKSATDHVIVNETFLKTFQVEAASAIGQTYTLADKTEVNVIGVIKDFHYTSLREPIKSFFFRTDPAHYRVANVKVASTDMYATLREMEAAWKPLAGEKKFTAQFFEDEIEEAYSVYFVMVKICGFLGFLAMTISCLGLLGMVIFHVENRIKEVGVRKVMGASTASLTVMLSKDFVKLMAIASVIAMPLAYFFFDTIFRGTTYYRIPIGATEIILGISILMILGLTTVLSQTVKAAQANPVDTLKCE